LPSSFSSGSFSLLTASALAMDCLSSSSALSLSSRSNSCISSSTRASVSRFLASICFSISHFNFASLTAKASSTKPKSSCQDAALSAETNSKMLRFSASASSSWPLEQGIRRVLTSICMHSKTEPIQIPETLQNFAIRKWSREC
ncbi:unnamed protein product, partial [Prunus brigantina]